MPSKAKTIMMMALSGVQLLDVSGPLDVFAEANKRAGYEAYLLIVAAAEPGPICSSSGVRLMPDRVIGYDFEEPIDTLLVAGCPNAADVPAAAPSWTGCGGVRRVPGALARCAAVLSSSRRRGCSAAGASPHIGQWRSVWHGNFRT